MKRIETFEAYPVYPARVGDTTEGSTQFQQVIQRSGTAQLLGDRGGRMQTMIFDSASEIDTPDALSGSTT